jgi:hypothetical protein
MIAETRMTIFSRKLLLIKTSNTDILHHTNEAGWAYCTAFHPEPAQITFNWRGSAGGSLQTPI